MTTATSRRSSSEGTRETQRLNEMAGHMIFLGLQLSSKRRSYESFVIAPARGSKRLRAPVPRARAGMRTNGFREDGALSLNAHQLGAATVYLGLAVRSRARAGSPRLRLPSPGAVSPVPTLTPHRSALPRALAQLGFYFLQAPAMEDGAVRLALEVAYACVCGVVTAAFYKAASTDPADDTRLQVRDERTHEREAIDARSPTASSGRASTARGRTTGRARLCAISRRSRRSISCGGATSWCSATASRATSSSRSTY